MAHGLKYINNNHVTVAIPINTGIKLYVACMYIPLLQNFSERKLKPNYSNSRSSIWGSAGSNASMVTIENFILIVLNNGFSTHFSNYNTFSDIDISICFYGIDHYPILTIVEKA